VLRPFIVAWMLAGRRAPWWMITPDDLPSYGPHFGYYEPTVRRVYDRFGKRIGDAYWLGKRNVLMGLRRRLTPTALRPQRDPNMGNIFNYAHLVPQFKRKRGRWVTRYDIGHYRCWKWTIGRRVKGIVGWKIDRIVDDPFNGRQPINMDGRPIFSPLRRID